MVEKTEINAAPSDLDAWLSGMLVEASADDIVDGVPAEIDLDSVDFRDGNLSQIPKF